MGCIETIGLSLALDGAIKSCKSIWMLKEDERRVIIRTGGVCFSNGRVLIHRAEQDNFWALPGGRSEPYETSAETLEREIREELNVSAKIGPLLWVIENFFEYEGTRYKEFGLYYRFEFMEDRKKLLEQTDFEGVESFTTSGIPMRLIFKWQPISELETVNLRPAVLKNELNRIPTSPIHLIHRDR